MTYKKETQETGQKALPVIIYNSSSFGGCYDYALALLPFYLKNPDVTEITLVLPKNAPFKHKGIKTILEPDLIKSSKPIAKKLYFLYRTFVNPLIFWFYLFNRPKSYIIFNDFEQLSAFVWVPFFRLLLGKHRFSIILHDPDRDAYPPSLAFTRFSMKWIMGIMDLGFYHDFLPDKPYYAKGQRTQYICIPHGIYLPAPANEMLVSEIELQKSNNFQVAAIVGNIRAEKNYHLAIAALPKFPKLKLLIAGKPSSGNVNIETYKNLANELKVSDRVIWYERFLSDEDLSAVLKASDLILLNYARSFTSQSGILNLLATYWKPIIVSEGESSLAILCKSFGLGIMVEPDSQSSFEKGLSEFVNGNSAKRLSWDAYLAYASWENNVKIAIQSFNNL